MCHIVIRRKTSFCESCLDATSQLASSKNPHRIASKGIRSTQVERTGGR